MQLSVVQRSKHMMYLCHFSNPAKNKKKIYIYVTFFPLKDYHIELQYLSEINQTNECSHLMLQNRGLLVYC